MRFWTRESAALNRPAFAAVGAELLADSMEHLLQPVAASADLAEVARLTDRLTADTGVVPAAVREGQRVRQVVTVRLDVSGAAAPGRG